MHTLHGHRSEPDANTKGRLIRWARWYDLMVMLLTFGRAPAMRERTAELANLQPGESVLEVGCGTGELTQRARLRVGVDGRVCGIDPSAEMIAVARHKAERAGLDIDYRVASIEALPLADASVDVVLSSVMMHHLPNAVKQLGLCEVRRVLKPGGRLLIVDFKRPTGLLSHLALTSFIHSHATESIEDLPTLVAAAGFSEVRGGEMGFRSLGVVSARAPH